MRSRGSPTWSPGNAASNGPSRSAMVGPSPSTSRDVSGGETTTRSRSECSSISQVMNEPPAATPARRTSAWKTGSARSRKARCSGGSVTRVLRTRWPSSEVRVAVVLGLEINPGVDVPRLELAKKFPARRLEDLIGQERVPGDPQPEGEVLRQGQRLRQLALHDGERARHRSARLPDFVDRMRRLELHPIGTHGGQVQIQVPEALSHAAVDGVAPGGPVHEPEARMEV